MAAPLDPAVTRARIVDAAMVLFAARGYDGVSTRDLGKRAEVNIATLNYHFGGKQRLYTAVVDEVYRRVRAELSGTLRPPETADPRWRGTAVPRRAVAGGLEPSQGSKQEDPRAGLREIVARFYGALRRERDGVRLILREVLDNGRLSNDLEQAHVLPNLDEAELAFAAMLGTSRGNARKALVAASFLASRFVVHDDAALARSLGVATTEEAEALAVDTLTDAIAAWLA
jgi:AcrR family transcriptional regulator